METEIIKFEAESAEFQAQIRALEKDMASFGSNSAANIDKAKNSMKGLGDVVKATTNKKPIQDFGDEIKGLGDKTDKTTKSERELVEEIKRLAKEEKEALKATEKLAKEEAKLAKEADKAAEKLRKQEQATAKASKGSSGFTKAISFASTALIAFFAVDKIAGFVGSIFSVRSEFQKLEAVLTNTLGSNSLAQKALSDIKNFAAVTPFSVQELTQSYVKLANQGFKPTVEQLRQLGDLASSTGKGFDQLTEAVIDAQTGEFERLKEFGIRAEKAGDKVTFTFKGVKTQTDFTNDSIRNYITSLGDLEGVSGSMAAISETLGGKISNLGDTWDTFLNTLGGNTEGIFAGVLSIFGKTLEAATNLVESYEQKLEKVQAVRIQKKLDANKIANDTEISRIEDSYKSRELAAKSVYEKEEALNEKLATHAEKYLALEKVVLEARRKSYQNLNPTNSTGDERRAIEQSIKDSEKQIYQYEYDLKLRTTLKDDYASKIKDIDKKIATDAEKAASDKEKADKKAAENQKKRDAEELKRLADLEQERRAYNDFNISLISDEYDRERAAKKENFDRTIQDSEKNIGEEIKLNSELYNKLWAALEKDLNDINQKELDAKAKFRKEQRDADDAAIDQQIQERMYANAKLKDAKGNDISEKDLKIKNLEDEIKAEDNRIAIHKAAGDKILKLEYENDQRRKELRELRLKDELSAIEKIKLATNAALQSGMDIADEVHNRKQQQLSDELTESKTVTDQKIQILKSELDSGVISKAKYNAIVARLNDQQARKEREIKRQQAQNEKNKALFDIAIATAVAIAKTGGNPFLIALAVATGAIQAGIVASRPIPKYAKGVIGLNGRGTETSDSIPAMLSKNESVMTAKETREHGSTLWAIRNGTLDKHVNESWVIPAIKKLERQRRLKEETTERSREAYNLDHLERLTARNSKVGIKNVDELADAILRRSTNKGLV
jgi:hypothetical protein